MASVAKKLASILPGASKAPVLAASPIAATSEVDDVCILRCREVFVYKVPTRRDASRGYRADQWGLESPLWIGECQIRAIKDELVFRLVKDGKPFVESIPIPLVHINRPPPNGKPLTLFVEPVVDSGRYFVIRFKDPNGRPLPMGMGFRERTDAFDFNASISDRITMIQRHLVLDTNAAAVASSAATAAAKHSEDGKKDGDHDDNDVGIAAAASVPSADWSLKGPIRISLPKKAKNDNDNDEEQVEGQPPKVAARPIVVKREGAAAFTIAPPPAGGAAFTLLPPPSPPVAVAIPTAHATAISSVVAVPVIATSRAEGIPVTLSPALVPSHDAVAIGMSSLTLSSSAAPSSVVVASADDDEWGSFESANT